MQLPNHFTLNHKHTHHDTYARTPRSMTPCTPSPLLQQQHKSSLLYLIGTNHLYIAFALWSTIPIRLSPDLYSTSTSPLTHIPRAAHDHTISSSTLPVFHRPRDPFPCPFVHCPLVSFLASSSLVYPRLHVYQSPSHVATLTIRLLFCIPLQFVHY